MRKLIICLAALAIPAAPAFASDKAGRLGTGDWTGAQLGVLYGYAWMKDLHTVLRLEAEGDGDTIGVYGVVNKQIGHFVGGGELTYTRHDNMFTDGSGVKVEDMFAAKLRAGGAYGRFHGYGAIGVARGTTNLAGDDWGTVYGVGFDVMLTRYLIAGLQYNFYNFVDFNHTKIDADINELTARVGYKF
ncbi:outer membrane protein [Roseitalea porphyridii]|uniref:Outer membrane protein beta-barrel domain-containing protein n=1 Tax=Roseitalea porphyridii TaxID=1852022 RepID=A0A4P6UYW1_9HYPH|nr:outer membrane beta-barrel protein [Roseitalea porphyridii]QBK29140.1 hypothetical protein E0E05_00160 [Roseitalea porphyridii]